jgi:hypothetical protein
MFGISLLITRTTPKPDVNVWHKLIVTQLYKPCWPRY